MAHKLFFCIPGRVTTANIYVRKQFYGTDETDGFSTEEGRPTRLCPVEDYPEGEQSKGLTQLP